MTAGSHPERISRWARLFVATAAIALVAWHGAVLAGLPRRVGVVLGLYGFVLHTVFGKAYSLVPSYFDRTLAFSRGPAVQLPLTAAGTACLAASALSGTPPWLETLGAVLWTAGVAVFLATMGWTVRDNFTGAETGTGDANAERRPVDRLANLFVPVVFLYLAVGTYGTLALATPLPVLVDGYPPRVSHLLAAGTAALLIFAVGFRLLPRFLVASPPRPLVGLALGAGALGPALIAGTLYDGTLFVLGAALEAMAVLAFAAAFVALFVRSDRDRVGFYGVLAGALAGVAGVAIGVIFAVDGATASLVRSHLRLNLGGFLGLTIVGVAYQFYPPTVSTSPLVGDRAALASIGAIAAGLAVEVAGHLGDVAVVATVGQTGVLLGAGIYASILLALFWERHWRAAVFG